MTYARKISTKLTKPVYFIQALLLVTICTIVNEMISKTDYAIFTFPGKFDKTFYGRNYFPTILS
jgi:hypothetical protein